MATNEQRLRNKGYAARFLDVSKSSIDRFRKNGDLAYILVGGQIRFTDQDLNNFIESRRGISLPRRGGRNTVAA
jgi:hypothetical protein